MIVRSFRVVEDDAQRGALSSGDGGNAVAHPDAVIAVVAPVGSFGGREDDERSLGRGEDVRAALSAGALLEQHELSAVEVLAAA